jgi:hypothetical protein
LKYQAVAAQLEFLAWRDTQLAAISTQLEDSFPDLLGDLSAQIDQASVVNLVRSTLWLRSSVEDLIRI